jgi:glutamate-1-semialdehyde aminotransferase
MPTFPSSENLFARAQKLMPGGVNSPVRAWQAVGGTPFLISKGVGSRINDLDGTPTRRWWPQSRKPVPGA